MKSNASRTGIGVAVVAAAMSFVWPLFAPVAYPWPSVGWAVLACVAALWAAKGSMASQPSMNDVINAVEAEPARAPIAPARGNVSSRPVL